MQLCLPVRHLLLSTLQASQISPVRSLSLHVPTSLVFPPGFASSVHLAIHSDCHMCFCLSCPPFPFSNKPHLLHTMSQVQPSIVNPTSSLWPSCHPLPGSPQTAAKRSVSHLPSFSPLPHGNSFFCLTAIFTGTKICHGGMPCDTWPWSLHSPLLGHFLVYHSCAMFILEWR